MLLLSVQDSTVGRPEEGHQNYRVHKNQNDWTDICPPRLIRWPWLGSGDCVCLIHCPDWGLVSMCVWSTALIGVRWLCVFDPLSWLGSGDYVCLIHCPDWGPVTMCVWSTVLTGVRWLCVFDPLPWLGSGDCVCLIHCPDWGLVSMCVWSTALTGVRWLCVFDPLPWLGSGDCVCLIHCPDWGPVTVCVMLQNRFYVVLNVNYKHAESAHWSSLSWIFNGSPFCSVTCILVLRLSALYYVVP